MNLDDQRIRRGKMTLTMRAARVGDGRATGRLRFRTRSRLLAVAVVILSMSAMRAASPSATHDGVVSFGASGSAHAQPSMTWSVHVPLAVRNTSVPPPPPALDVPWTRDADAVIGGAAWAVDVVGDVAYVGVGAHVIAYDVSGDGEPVFLGASPPLPGRVLDVVVRDGYAFAAVFQNSPIDREYGGLPAGVYVLDVRIHAEMSVVTLRAMREGPRDLELDGDRLLALAARPRSRSASLLVFDIVDPIDPRMIRRGDFEYGWRSATLVGNHAYLCNGDLDVLDLDASRGEWFVAEDIVECERVTHVESSGHLATVSEISSLKEDDSPTLRLFDVAEPGRPALIGELPLIDFEFGVEPSASDYDIQDVRAVGSSVFISGLIKRHGPFLIEVDVSEPTAPRLVSTRRDVAAGLAVDGDGDRLVVAGSIPIGWDYGFGDIRYGDRLGSAISVLSQTEDGEMDVTATVSGPSTVLSTAACQGGAAFVFEAASEGPETRDRVWAYDLSGVHPIAMDMAELPVRRAIVEAGHAAVAVSEDGVFAALDGAIHDVRWQDGRLELVESIEDSGALVRSGDHLVVAADDGMLRVYDVSVPGSARRVGSVELPIVGRRRGGAYDLIEHKGAIWVLAVSPDGEPARAHLMVVRVDDPTRPAIGSSTETSLEMGDPFLATLAGADDTVWVVTSYPTTIGRYSTADDGSEPRLVARLDHRRGGRRYDPWSMSFAASEDRIWLPSAGFWEGYGELFEVEAADEATLQVASIRTAPAAMHARHDVDFDTWRGLPGYGGVSSCGARIVGTTILGGMFVVDPAKMLFADDSP